MLYLDRLSFHTDYNKAVAVEKIETGGTLSSAVERECGVKEIQEEDRQDKG